MATQPPLGPPIPFVLFSGPAGPGEVEALVDGARRAAALDLLERACQSGRFSPVLLTTPDTVPAESLPSGVDVLSTSREADFHMGRALQEIVRSQGFQRVLCGGAGAGPLLHPDDLSELAAPLQGETPVVVANNLHSADLVGVTPTSALEGLDLPADDNGLAFLLWRKVGLPGHEPPRTAATQFDLDTPTDLLVAALHPHVGPRLRSHLASLHPDPSTLRTAARVFRNPQGQAIVAGRVGSQTWAYLERETACRIRLFAEERGMRALGLEGEARSLLGLLLESVGLAAFMNHLGELGDAAFIDTRVLLAHRRSQASREDRFLSDLGSWRKITDPFLREFTQAANEAPIPIALGGHSLVSGGLMALVEATWAENDNDNDQQEEHVR